MPYHKKRKTDRPRILTDTPVRNEMRLHQENKTNKQQITASKKKPGKRSSTITVSATRRKQKTVVHVQVTRNQMVGLLITLLMINRRQVAAIKSLSLKRRLNKTHFQRLPEKHAKGK
jgi:hypothetical protein